MLRRPRAFESAATQRSRIARDQYWRIARRRGRRPRGNTEIQSDPNFKARFYRVFFEIVQATKLAAVPVVAVAVPSQSAVQLPFPKKGASVTGVFVANLRPTGHASRKCPKNH